MSWDHLPPPPKPVLLLTLISDTFGAVELLNDIPRSILQGFVASGFNGEAGLGLSLFSEDLTVSVLSQCLSRVHVSTAPDSHCIASYSQSLTNSEGTWGLPLEQGLGCGAVWRH